MVTFIEAGFFGYFNSLFIFLFVLVVMYAILAKSKLLGDNNAIAAVVAFVVAAVFASSSYASRVFEYATPWIVMLIVLLLLLEIIVKFMGAEKTMPLGESTPIMIIVLVLVLIIFMLAGGQVSKEKKADAEKIGENLTENPVLSFPAKIGETLRHPAVLGLICVLLIATFAIMLLARQGA